MKQTSIQSNTIYNVIKSAAAIVFPLISFPYASRVLLTESIGKVNFGNSVVSYVTLIATLGITTYAVRECAKVKDSKQELSKVASQLFSINILTTVIAYLLLALTLLFARPLDDYRLLIVVQSTAVMFATFGADWLNTAMEDFRYVTLRTVLFQVLSLVLMFMFVHTPDDYLIYALIGVVSSSGANVVNIFYRRKYCRVRITHKMDLKKHMPPILLLFSMILAQTIYCNSDITMIGLFWNDHEVGLYSTAVKIYNIVNTMVASVALVVIPQLSQSFAKKDYSQINSLLRYGLNFIIVLGLPCIVGINAASEGIITLMAGQEYVAAAPALRVLTISLAASFISGFQGNMMLIPAGKDKPCLLSAVVSAVVNVVLNFVFIPRFGIVAAAFTTATAEIVGLLIKLPYIDKRLNIGNLKSLLLSPLCGSAAIVLIAIAMKALVSDIILQTCLIIGISIVAYLAILLVMKNEFILGIVRKGANHKLSETGE